MKVSNLACWSGRMQAIGRNHKLACYNVYDNECIIVGFIIFSISYPVWYFIIYTDI